MATTLPLVSSPTRYRQRVRGLDGAAVVLHLQWLPRTRGWYVWCENSAGDRLCASRRIEPGALSVLPDRTLPGAPAGRLVVDGLTAYVPSALGELVSVVYVTASDLEALS